MESALAVLKFVYCAVMVLLLFNITIFVHELGHFLLARWRKLKVETFAIWFGPAIWKKRIGGVEYVLGSIPLGGYVKLPQLQPDDPIEGKSDTPREDLPYAPPKDRIPTLFAGSAFNFIFAILIAAILWVTGIPVDKSMLDLTVAFVPKGSVEDQAGIRAGDKIVAINGKKMNDWQEVRLEMALGGYQSADIQLLRDGAIQTVQLIPARDPVFNLRQLDLDSKQTVVLQEVAAGKPGAEAGLKPGDRIVSFDGIPVLGISHFIGMIHTRADKACTIEVSRDGKLLKETITPKMDADMKFARIWVVPTVDESEKRLIHLTPYEQVGGVILQMVRMVDALVQHRTTGVSVGDFSGPIGIVAVLFKLVGADIRLALSFLVLLNVNLALLNLLPIPVLDGGHIVFTILEWIRKKPLNYKLMEAIQTTFVILLLGFILYVSFNDVRRTGWFSRAERPAKAVEPAKAK